MPLHESCLDGVPAKLTRYSPYIRVYVSAFIRGKRAKIMLAGAYEVVVASPGKKRQSGA